MISNAFQFDFVNMDHQPNRPTLNWWSSHTLLLSLQWWTLKSSHKVVCNSHQPNTHLLRFSASEFAAPNHPFSARRLSLAFIFKHGPHWRRHGLDSWYIPGGVFLFVSTCFLEKIHKYTCNVKLDHLPQFFRCKKIWIDITNLALGRYIGSIYWHTKTPFFESEFIHLSSRDGFKVKPGGFIGIKLCEMSLVHQPFSPWAYARMYIYIYIYITSWWLNQPISKISVKMGIFPRKGGK